MPLDVINSIGNQTKIKTKPNQTTNKKPPNNHSWEEHLFKGITLIRQQLWLNSLSTDSFADNSFKPFSLLFSPAFFFKALATTCKKHYLLLWSYFGMETREYRFLLKDTHVTELSKAAALAWLRLLQAGCSWRGRRLWNYAPGLEKTCDLTECVLRAYVLKNKVGPYFSLLS